MCTIICLHILRTYYCNLLHVCIYYIRNMYPDRVFTQKKLVTKPPDLGEVKDLQRCKGDVKVASSCL